MTELETIRTETAHRCAGCGHAHDHHATRSGQRCSADWCPCTASVAEVKAQGEPYDREVYAAPFGGRS
jgi:hypothetical protein